MKTVVVLGCALRKCNGTEEMKGRVTRGLETYSSVGADLLILTGGLTSPECGTTESEVMESMIPPDIRNNIHVELEKKSRTTIENALYTREILESKELNSTLYVSTSCYHMNRALRIFSIMLPNTDIRSGLCFECSYDSIRSELQKYEREIEMLESFDWTSKEYMSYLL